MCLDLFLVTQGHKDSVTGHGYRRGLRPYTEYIHVLALTRPVFSHLITSELLSLLSFCQGRA